MGRGKAAKKATPGRQGTLGVSVHPHIKKPSHVIGMQIGVLWHQRGGRTQLGARAGSGRDSLIKRRARRVLPSVVHCE